ncbi:MAG: cell division protein FtsQ/DivIB [Glycocaulis sp.]
MRRNRTAPTRAGQSGATRSRTRKPPQAIPPRRVVNWASAQLRTARYRTVSALRLGALAALLVSAIALAGLAVTGGLSGLGDNMARMAENRLTGAGFVVRAVDLAGGREVSAAEIASVIGAEPGRGLLSIDPREARAAIEAMSRVESASVARLWPDRISVVITERAPYALWQSGGVHHVIDRNGVVLTGEAATDHAYLPRVVGEGANVQAAEIVTLLARQPELSRLVTHAVRVGERRWNLRLHSGSDILLPETNIASALALIAALHADQRLLELDAQAFDLRGDGELVVRAWPERAGGAAQRERGA